MRKGAEMEEQIIMEYTFIKTQTHTEMGEYKRTTIDDRKEHVDFRLLQVSPYIIKWKDGKVERINKQKLTKLQKNHVWVTDF